MATSPFRVLCSCLAGICTLAIGADSERVDLHGFILDAASGRPLPCTVAITDADQRIVTRSPALAEGFRCAGEFRETLPAGPARVRVYRGFEYEVWEETVDLLPGRTKELTIRLERIVDLRSRGWYAGDSHAHMIHGERTFPVSFEDVALAARAEDLQYLSVSHAWQMERPSPEALDQVLSALSSPDCVLTWNLEAPKNYYRGDAGRCLGHCWTLGMGGRTAAGQDVIPLLTEASAGDYQSQKPPFANFESHRLIHEQGGKVFYTHPLRWWTGAWGGRGGYARQERMRISNLAVELPLDVLAGPTFDGIDLLTGAREHAANAKAFRLWSLLLNRGYRLAATGSSDACFDRPGGAVPGVPRTYTYLPEGFSWSALAEATAAGRTFVTSGPLLVATVDGQPPGTVFPANGQRRSLSIEAWASARPTEGLRRIEIVRNGEAWRTVELPAPVSSWRSDLELRESGSAWYCVRARGKTDNAPQAISGAFYFEPDDYEPPQPVPIRVLARIVDTNSGQALSGTLTEVAYAGPLPEPGREHRFENGEITLQLSATVRLRAQAQGYEPKTLSPFLDDAQLVETITQLEDQDLLNWETYERVRERMRQIRLTFQMERTDS